MTLLQIRTQQSIFKGAFEKRLAFPWKAAHAKHRGLALRHYGRQPVAPELTGQSTGLFTGRKGLIAMTAKFHDAELVPVFQGILLCGGMLRLLFDRQGFSLKNLFIMRPVKKTGVEYLEQGIQIFGLSGQNAGTDS